MTIINKKAFTVEINGKEVKLAAMRPKHEVGMQAEIIYGSAFRKATEGGMMLRSQLSTALRDRNLWDDKKEADFQANRKTLLEGEMKLKKGGLKLSEAKKIAIDMRIARYQLQLLSATRNELDMTTAEYFADNQKFNYLISQCIVYEDDGKPYYSSYESYLELTQDPVSSPGADALAAVVHQMEDDFESKLPENKFLLKHGMCNKELALIDKQGNLVDAIGHRINEKGQRINDDGKRIDGDGNVLTDDGEYDVESAPFLDDDTGLPIPEGVTTTDEVGATSDSN